MDPGILDLNARVVFFPVRHHSPAAARALRTLAAQMKPSAILIEGPADFNPHLAEMALPHTLPIAIYSYVRLADGLRRGAFYPFCVYSPEWQALEIARELNADAEFIDLPWADLAAEGDKNANRYADAELKRSGYVASLCAKLGVDDLNALWDTLFEIDPDLSVSDYLALCHQFCYSLRAADGQVPSQDYAREAFMAARIHDALARTSGRILVVTGGFHSHALYARLHSLAFEDASNIAALEAPMVAERGIALTPYSYERLDSLTGYESGMPNPGFYDEVWHRRSEGRREMYRALLEQAVTELRRRGQTASSADLIAVEASAQGLADLRGHAEVWRLDLLDGILGALVKDEQGARHPFLQVLHSVFRGKARGRLADGTTLPPLVSDIERQMAEAALDLTAAEQAVTLDLYADADRTRSRVLHRMRVLGLPGWAKTGGSDLAKRDDLAQVWEQWRGRWTPEGDAAAIESALYGATLADASAARLTERLAESERDAEAAALALLDTALMGLPHLAPECAAQMRRLVREDGDFFALARALGHLLYLYHYDAVLGTASTEDFGALLAETYARCLWLLETLGGTPGRDKELLEGLRLLVDTQRRAGPRLELDPEELAVIFQRTASAASHSALLRGGSVGALWALGQADMGRVLSAMQACSAPEKIGDFLTGLFHLARETAQRDAELVQSLNVVLLGYDAEAFLAALPALRLAFSYFAPREKYYLAQTLTQPQPQPQLETVALEVTPEAVALVLVFEERVFADLRKYGLRGA